MKIRNKLKPGSRAFHVLLHTLPIILFFIFKTDNLHSYVSSHKSTQEIEQKVKSKSDKKIEIAGIEVTDMMEIDEIVNKISEKNIIYVGEKHDRYEHHLSQLEIIKAIYNKSPKVAIGMEMFQRNNQKALNDYVEGIIDEREMLRESGYFKNWGYNYFLYRDILSYARDKGIPVVALNLKRKIVSKVYRGGFDGLTTEESKTITEDIDLSDNEYKERLKEIFQGHANSDERSFEYFYQAQVLWDETMAESADLFLKENPGYKMVVLAGSGHLMYGSGIPKRAHRRNGLDYSIILNDESIERGKSDFVLFPKEAEPEKPPLLMVYLSKDEEGVKITGFPKNSISEQAGMYKDDIILSIDNEEINTIEDIKIALFYKSKGDTIKVKVRRAMFLFLGSREKVIEVVL